MVGFGTHEATGNTVFYFGGNDNFISLPVFIIISIVLLLLIVIFITEVVF